MSFYTYISDYYYYFLNKPVTKENKSQQYVWYSFQILENGYQEFATCKSIIK